MQVKNQPEIPSIVDLVSPYFIAQFIEVILLFNIITSFEQQRDIWFSAEAKLSEAEHTYTNEDSDLYSEEQSGGAGDGPKSKISLVHTPQKYSPFIVHLQW